MDSETIRLAGSQSCCALNVELGTTPPLMRELTTKRAVKDGE